MTSDSWFEFFSQGGIFAFSPPLSLASLLSTEIAVAPPREFSPTYEVITISDASITPRSSICPKLPRSVEKASLNKPLPILLL